MRLPLFLALLTLAGCGHGGQGNAAGIAPSGGGTARSYAVDGFSKIDVRGPDDADVRIGGVFSVRAQGPADLLDQLQIEKVGDTLRISRRAGSNFNWGGRQVRVHVTMPRIAGASGTGSGDISIDRVTGGSFAASVAGSSDVAIGDLAADRATVDISGSGDVTAAGTVKALAVSISGAGDVKASGLTASSATVSIAGSGDVAAHVVGPAQVSVMGSGDVDLGPEARCTVSNTGSGDVHCGH